MLTGGSTGAEADAQAFAALYDAQFERLYRFLRYRVDDPALAEDLAAEVFSRAWATRGTLRTPDAAVGWLFTTARRLVADRYRRGTDVLPLDAVPPGRLPGTAAPEEGVLRAEREALVRRYVGELGERERAIVELRFVAGLRNREIAPVVGLSEGNVAKILHRTLRRLRARLTSEEDPDADHLSRAIQAPIRRG